MGDSEATEITLARLPANSDGRAHVYKLPPRPDARGWKCQEWPKESHIFAARVNITAKGDVCTIKLIDPENGTLFAQCPLDNDNPHLSVEPATDSSRYFVLRVSDGSGRYAYLGMGFLERPDAFEFNVTLQDHVKHLRQEKEAIAAANAPQAPPQDFSLKGSVSIALPGGASSAPRARPAAAAGAAAMPLMPPPPGGGGQPSRGRQRGSGAAPAAVAAANPFAPTAGSSDFGASDPFAPSADPFGSSTPFGGADFAATSTPSGTSGEATMFPTDAPAAAFGTEAGGGGGGDWVAFG